MVEDPDLGDLQSLPALDATSPAPSSGGGSPSTSHLEEIASPGEEPNFQLVTHRHHSVAQQVGSLVMQSTSKDVAPQTVNISNSHAPQREDRWPVIPMGLTLANSLPCLSNVIARNSERTTDGNGSSPCEDASRLDQDSANKDSTDTWSQRAWSNPNSASDAQNIRFEDSRGPEDFGGPSAATPQQSFNNAMSVSRPAISRALTQPNEEKRATDKIHRVFYGKGRHSLASPFDEARPSRKLTDITTGVDVSNPSYSPTLDIPLPPFSIPTYLQLEMSSERPSSLYIYRPSPSEVPYETSRVKFERLTNFLLLPPQLERVLLFGALTCLDAWLYTFTILPLRFLRATWILALWICSRSWNEVRSINDFVYVRLGRLWRRFNSRKLEIGHKPSAAMTKHHQDANEESDSAGAVAQERSNHPHESRKQPSDRWRDHRRSKSISSPMCSNDKADLLQGLLIICACALLMRFDASKMYHGIRGQAAIKLYVIYNVLEVFDRLFSALGQDILECLFSPDTLDRHANGRRKVIAPLWMFIIALIYTILHSAAFFYQVITLNVAVNSYSNALLTLLMSNQFVEIKGAVFKKFEKENLFQMTCADVVERFQLWLMLLIIALRNIVELGGLSLGSVDTPTPSDAPSASGPFPPNATSASSLPQSFSLLPDSFSILPSPAQLQLLTPFLLVLGSEMLVDWLKHAYITKFNATTPRIYARYFDVLAKDYYINAFGNQNLVKRLGLPVIPLSCLFIRAVLQTYHMFLATNVSTNPLPMVAATTSLDLDNGRSAMPALASPALAPVDAILRSALGRSSLGGCNPDIAKPGFWSNEWWAEWTFDDVIALTTMVVFFAAVYLLLLACKLVLGMFLLSIARDRYRGMQDRERGRRRDPFADAQKLLERESRRMGGWGVVEVGEDNRRIIYDGDEKGLTALRNKEAKARENSHDQGSVKDDGLEKVNRYSMVAKRIW